MKNNKLITTIIEEKLEGNVGRGKSKIPFIKQIMEDTYK